MTVIVGGATGGYCAIGRMTTAITLTSITMMARTHAKINRSMKKLIICASTCLSPAFRWEPHLGLEPRRVYPPPGLTGFTAIPGLTFCTPSTMTWSLSAMLHVEHQPSSMPIARSAES